METGTVRWVGWGGGGCWGWGGVIRGVMMDTCRSKSWRGEIGGVEGVCYIEITAHYLIMNLPAGAK